MVILIEFPQALECDDPWVASIRLNQAVLAGRRGQPAKAIELLDEVDDPHLKLEAAENRIANLKRLDRTDEARSLTEQTLAEDQDEEKHGDTLARIAALLGEDVDGLSTDQASPGRKGAEG